MAELYSTTDAQVSLTPGIRGQSSNSALSFYSTNYHLEPTVAPSENSSLSALPFYAADFFLDTNGELVVGFDQTKITAAVSSERDDHSWKIPSCLKLDGGVTSNDLIQHTKVLYSSNSDITVTEKIAATIEESDLQSFRCDLELERNYPSSFSNSTVIDGHDDSSEGIFIQREVKGVLLGRKYIDTPAIGAEPSIDEISEIFHKPEDVTKIKDAFLPSTTNDRIISKREVIRVLKSKFLSVKVQQRLSNVSSDFPVVYPQACIIDAAHFYKRGIEPTASDIKYGHAKSGSHSESSSTWVSSMYSENGDEGDSTLGPSNTTMESKTDTTNKTSYFKKLSEHCTCFEPSEVIEQLPKQTVITGVAGIGKTTLLIRLYNLSSKTQPSFFSQISLIKDPCSLKTFFLRNMTGNGINLGDAEQVYVWLESHQFDCTLFLDGLDEVPWGLSSNPRPVLNNEELSVTELLASFFHVKTSEKFNNMKIVTAGRPHSVLMLPPKVRPDKVMYLDNLLTEDAALLLTHFSGEDAAVWKNIPREMFDFCRTPFNIQMMALVYKGTTNSKFDSLMDIVISLLLLMCRTDGFIYNIDQLDMRKELAKLSYLCHHMSIEKDTVVFGYEEIMHFNINENVINAFCIPRSKTDIRDFYPVDDDSVFEFCHRIFQESLSALFPLFLSEADFDSTLTTFWPITPRSRHYSIIRQYFLDLLFNTDNASLGELLGPQQNVDEMRMKVQKHIVNVWENQNSLPRHRSSFSLSMNRGGCFSSMVQRFTLMKIRRKPRTRSYVPYGVDLLLDGAYVSQKAALAILFPSDGFAFSAKRSCHEVETQFKVASFITKTLTSLTCEISCSDQYIENSKLLLHGLSQLETNIIQLTLTVSSLAEVPKLVPPICRLIRDEIVTGRLMVGDLDTGDEVDDVKDLWEVEVRAACTMIRDACRYNNVSVDFFAQWSDLKDESSGSSSVTSLSDESSSSDSDEESCSGEVRDESTSTSEIPTKTNENSQQEYEKILTLLNAIDDDDEDNNAI